MTREVEADGEEVDTNSVDLDQMPGLLKQVLRVVVVRQVDQAELVEKTRPGAAEEATDSGSPPSEAPEPQPHGPFAGELLYLAPQEVPMGLGTPWPAHPDLDLALWASLRPRLPSSRSPALASRLL